MSETSHQGLLDRIVAFALRQRVLVVASALALLFYGMWSAKRLPVDVFPDLNRPTVTLMTEAHALSPEEVELLVTRPIEVAMNGAPNVERVRSQSGVGLSVVYVEFGWDSDILVNRQMVAERLASVRRDLPEGIEPEMGPITSIMGEFLLVGVTSIDESTPPTELRTLSDFIIRRELLSLPGVAHVTVIGGGAQQLRIHLNPERLAQFNLTVDEVIEATSKSQGNGPGGFLDHQSQEWLIRTVARTSDLDKIAQTVVATRAGSVVRLSDVATLAFEPGVMRGDAGVNAEPAVILSVQKQPNASTIDLTKAVEARIQQLAAQMPEKVEIKILFRQADFISAATDNVMEALRDGAILVVLVLFLFLQNLRTTFITLTAIPLSLAVTAVVFELFNISVNTMTLGGIAVAIGELVDDAIVDTENVFRRLRENRQLAHPRHPLRVVWDASIEVRGSIVFATMIVILVFIPLFGLSGLEGRLFAPLALAYIISILASLVVSITVTPVLCSYLLPNAKITEHDQDGWLVRKLKAMQLKVLAFTMRHPFRVMGATLLAFFATVAVLPFFGREFLPEFNEGTATINVMGQPGISLSNANQLGRAAEAIIMSVPEVKSVGRRTGRAELDEHAEGVHYGELEVDFHQDMNQRPRSEVLAELRERLSVLPGVSVNIGQPISHRLDHMLSGVRAELVVKVAGPDLGELRQLSAQVEAVMQEVAGLVDIQSEKLVLVPELRILVRDEVAARYGLRPVDISQQVERLLDGVVATQLLEADRTLDVFVRLDEKTRSDLGQMGRVLLDTPQGVKVPLNALADIQLTRSPNMVMHDNGQRRMAVMANVQERDLASAVAELKGKLDALALPAGYGLSIEGQFQSQEQATFVIGLLSLVSLGLMVLVLHLHFRSFVLVAQVLVNIPQALIGSVLALWLFQLPLSVATLVGFVALCGIASRNTIMMLDHYLHLAQYEGMQFGPALIVRGSLERLVPVLMTAVTAGLGLIPLVLSADAPGKEILHPVAVVILGGLISSTALDLLVTPVVFWAFGKGPLSKRLARAQVGDVLADGAMLSAATLGPKG